MYCPNCRKKLDDDALFCDECGTKIERQKPTAEPTPKVQETLVVEEEPAKEVIRTEPVEKINLSKGKQTPKKDAYINVLIVGN